MVTLHGGARRHRRAGSGEHGPGDAGLLSSGAPGRERISRVRAGAGRHHRTAQQADAMTDCTRHPRCRPSRPMAYVALTKPDVSFLVVITTLAGYALGAVGPLDWLRMAQTVIGTTLVAAGTSALNHYSSATPTPACAAPPRARCPAARWRPRKRSGSAWAGRRRHYRACCSPPTCSRRCCARHFLGIWASTRRSRRAPPLPRSSARFPARCRP